MKTIMKFAAIIATVLTICSCGASKKMLSAPVQNVQTTSPAQNQLSKQELNLNDCEKAELAEGEYMRAATSAKSYDLDEAKMMAEENARTLLATRIQTAVENATKSYNKNAGTGTALSEKRIRERINRQFCAETVGGLRIVALNKYALPNGTIEYHVCYEMIKNKDKVIQNVMEEVKKDEEFQIKSDELQFEKEMEDGLNAHKKSKSE